MSARPLSLTLILLAAVRLAAAQEPPMGPLRPDQVAFRALFKEMVETNTTLSSGSCTLLAQRVAAHLRAAGFPDRDITLFSVAGHPKEGGVVAVLHGTSPTAKPMLLLGHLDVVEAKRADWTRDPFTLIEENGYFYGRGTADMKGMDATWVDALMRFKRAGYRGKRTITMALTCGEETTGAFNGADWLAKYKPQLIAAAFALNEGGGGRTDGRGKLMLESMQVGEKAARNYSVEATNAGGHSSTPIRDNAVYELAEALLKVRDHEFPVKFTDTTRAFFARAGAARDDELGHAMVALALDPADRAAEAIVSRDRAYHSMLRTTCVATLLSGGHAENALPQRATANVNCRIFPGESVEEVRAALVAAIADPRITVTAQQPSNPVAVPPPLDPKIMEPAERLAARYFPGVPLVPTMSTGATDGIYLEAIGIPVYGVPGFWADPDGNGVHGLNERRSVRALYVGRDFLTDLIKAYADSDDAPRTAVAGGVFHVTPVRPVAELLPLALAATPPAQSGAFRPADLVELTSLDPSIRLDIRYAGTRNFLGTPLYSQARAFLQRPAAEALVRVQRSLASEGYGLLVHDAYRPWYVTKIFWDAMPADLHRYVADPAEGSRHNRGCAVDLTLYDLRTGREVEMPSVYDEPTERAWPAYGGGTAGQRRMRDLLRRHMEAEGFAVYEFEWWHFDYRDWQSYRIGNVRFEDLGATE